MTKKAKWFALTLTTALAVFGGGIAKDINSDDISLKADKTALKANEETIADDAPEYRTVPLFNQSIHKRKDLFELGIYGGAFLDTIKSEPTYANPANIVVFDPVNNLPTEYDVSSMLSYGYQGDMNVYFFSSSNNRQAVALDTTYDIYIYDNATDLNVIVHYSDITTYKEAYGADISDFANEFGDNDLSLFDNATVIPIQKEIFQYVKDNSYLFALKFNSGSFSYGGIRGITFQNKDTVAEDGETVDIAVNVDDAPSIEDILAQVTAQDLLGASVDVSCTAAEREKYNPNLLGTYLITITATDSYGQTSTAYLNIKVIDVTAPTVVMASGKNFNFHVGDTLVYSSLASYFTITDNATGKGGTIGNPVYKIDDSSLTDDYTFTTVGTHTLNVSVSDSSGNNTTKNFTITVTDNEAPVVARRDGGTGSIIVGLSRAIVLEDSDFLALFSATDGVDGDVSSTLALAEGSSLPVKVGSYDLKIVATDKSGNEGSLTVTLMVSSDVPPVFILSDNLVNATTSNPLTSSQIQQLVSIIYDDANVTAANILINDSEYQANSTKVGSYSVSYAVNYTDDGGELHSKKGILTIAVVEGAETEELSGWKWFWQCMKNWFRGVFTKFQFDCFITDTDWDIRFA